ncbi:MAG: transglutaminase domain-containing protein, partial [candidate division Zixibacteria bacterium]|nr:transglutaminase domain-containing protein [candidate division Zixibacteria bacterium]
MYRVRIIGLVMIIGLLMWQPSAAAPGDTVKSFSTPFDCPQGLAFDGKYIWNVDRLSDMIYQIEPSNGAVVDSIPTPGYIPRGLAWDGKWLWCVDSEEGLIFAIDPKTKIVEKTIYCPVSRPTGLAWDGNYLWIAANRNDRIRKVSIEDGTTILSIPSPTHNTFGLTFDGTYLWVSDRYRDMIYMVKPDNGDVVLCFDSPGPHSWGLAWDGSHLLNVDYQTDLIYKLIADDETSFTRSNKKSQQIKFIHQVRNFGPDSVLTLDVYLAVPQNLDNQELIGPVEFTPKPTDMLVDKWGQKVAHFHFTDIAATNFTTVTMLASVELYETRYFISPDKVGKLKDIPKSILEKYLTDDSKFSIENEIVRDAVKKAVGDETNPYWIGRKIFNYVIEHIEYELAGGWNIAPAILDRGNGSCSEYSFVYIAMCRAAGLPARYAGSIAVRGDDASYDDVFHRWVEIYLPGYGWLPVDPSGGDSKWPSARANSFGHLNNRFLITTLGGGGSEYLEWGYNANERWTSRGKCKIVVENFGEWTPLKPQSD